MHEALMLFKRQNLPSTIIATLFVIVLVLFGAMIAVIIEQLKIDWEMLAWFFAALIAVIPFLFLRHRVMRKYRD